MKTEQSLEETVRLLDARHRRLSKAYVLTLLVTGGVIAMGAWSPARVVEAQKFVLRDANGKSCAVLEPTSQGARLVLKTFTGQTVASLESSAIGPLLDFKSEQGKECARLQVAKGQPVLSLYDEKNTRRRLTLLIHQERAGLFITGSKEQSRLELVDKASGPELRVKGSVAIPTASTK
jgi:hypothetical protein